VEVTKKQNEDLKIINAKLTETQFSLVQSEKMAAIGQLSAGIAHEINNPMGFVSSNFDVLQKYFKRITEYLTFVTEQMQGVLLSDNPAVHEAAKEVMDKYHSLKLEIIMEELKGLFSDSSTGIQRITEIIQSLRVFSRASYDGDREMRVLHEIIAQVLLITRNEVKYVAKAEMDVPEDISLFCNRVQLGQVFVNIIVNAAQAIKTQKRSSLGSIMVRAKKTDQKVIIEISDDGPGIPAENLSKIFEPFYTTKDVGQGTGLGLSISYDIIVNKHKGTIDVQSELGKGTTFIITLPIIIAE
ncbi:MAG: ATP-binding protein, partial [Mobilitalea sp.]